MHPHSYTLHVHCIHALLPCLGTHSMLSTPNIITHAYHIAYLLLSCTSLQLHALTDPMGLSYSVRCTHSLSLLTLPLSLLGRLVGQAITQHHGKKRPESLWFREGSVAIRLRSPETLNPKTLYSTLKSIAATCEQASPRLYERIQSSNKPRYCHYTTIYPAVQVQCADTTVPSFFHS